MGCANDGASADLDRARMAAGPIANLAPELPISAELLGLCDYRDPTLWGGPWGLDGPETYLPLPSLGRPGLRPSAMTRFHK